MPELFTGKVDIQNGAQQVTFSFDGNTGDAVVGGNSQTGDIVVRDGPNSPRVRIDGSTGTVSTRSAAQVLTITLNGAAGDIVLRGVNTPGQGAPRIRILASEGNIWLGGNGQDGDLVLFRSQGDNASLKSATMHLDGGSANIWLGGNGADSDLVLLPSKATDINDVSQASIHLDGEAGNIFVNRGTPKQRCIHIDGPNANIWLGGNGSDGDLVLFPSKATDIGDVSQSSIHLNGEAGDIILRNADCAEDFDVADGEVLEPGTVVMIDEDGCLRTTEHAYDRRVVGVVSGAGDHRPGIVLDRQAPTDANRQTVALMGKVYCKSDATAAPIRAGDLLVPSAVPGHAMTAASGPDAFGAVIGKALRSLATGRGLVPILVTLQ